MREARCCCCCANEQPSARRWWWGYSANDDAAPLHLTQLWLFFCCLCCPLNYQSICLFFVCLAVSRLLSPVATNRAVLLQLHQGQFSAWLHTAHTFTFPKVGSPANQGLLLPLLIFPIRCPYTLFIFCLHPCHLALFLLSSCAVWAYFYWHHHYCRCSHWKSGASDRTSKAKISGKGKKGEKRLAGKRAS